MQIFSAFISEIPTFSPFCLEYLQVERLGDLVTPPLTLTVTYPFQSPLGNLLLFLTDVHSPKVCAYTNTHTHTLRDVQLYPSIHTHPRVNTLFFALQVKCTQDRVINFDENIPIKRKKETLSTFLLVSDRICAPSSASVFPHLPD